MSRFNELINKLCPDGVKFLFLGEICEIKTGKGITKKDSVEGGSFPIISGGKEPMGMYHLTNRQANTVTISRVGANAGFVNFIDVDFYLNDKCFSAIPIEKYKNKLDSKFLYEYLKNNEQKITDMQSEGGVPTINIKKVSSVAVPVPPLEVQREIVRVLDSFTLLTAELTAELTARKKQYEFYRDKMLNFGDKAKIYKICELCESIADGDHMPPPKSSEGIPFITISNIDQYHNIDFENTMYVPESYYNSLAEKRKARKGDILYTVVGSYGMPVCIEDDKKFIFQRHIAILRPNKDIIKTRYMFHAMQSTDFKIQADKSAKGAAQKTIALSALGEMKMSVPSIDVQEKIIKVLDNFEAICTDLNIGLPAEIEARQKQYEYYRDLLLTFAEKGDMLLTDGPIRSELSAIKLIQYVFGYVTLPMGKLFDFRNGLSKGKDFFGSGIPFIRYTDVYNNRFLKKENITALVECTSVEIEKLGVHRGDVFFTRTSETAEDIGWSSVMLDDIGECVFNGFTIKATPKTNYLLPEYCEFCFATQDFRKYVTSHCAFTTRASLTGKTISEYLLDIPSIEKQQEIVTVLSKFHTLCNDLSSGLPAEIEARQKQYEYYRDKLLSFKELQK